MKKIAIIPARGGSKRFPQKNIALFRDVPIMAYTIRACIDSNIFDEIMVSTDDVDIETIARTYGASVPFRRSNENSTDFASTKDVILEVLNWYENKNIYFDVFCCIYPTAFLITGDMITNSYELLGETTPAVISVVQYNHPIQRSMSIKNDIISYNYPEYQNKRTQDIGPSYYDAGQLYWQRIESFKYNATLVPPGSVPYILNENEIQDIDNKEDFELAKLKYVLKHEKNNSII